MSQISEIKCSVCGKWCNWTSKIDERCPNCDAQLNPVRFQYEEEKRINTERNRLNSFLVIKENEDPIVQMLKQFVNWLGWTTFYGISAIYFVIALMVILYGLAMV
jgi:predicted amidophosphoribosyltransferase